MNLSLKWELALSPKNSGANLVIWRDFHGYKDYVVVIDGIDYGLGDCSDIDAEGGQV